MAISKVISYIPEDKIEKIQIYVNTSKLSMEEIQEKTKADYIINGGLYTMSTYKPNCHLKVDGKVLASDPYTYHGYSWNNANDFMMRIVPTQSNDFDNYICCTDLIVGRKASNPLYYNKDMGGKRGRTAIGIKGDTIAIYVSDDGTSAASTPENLRDELFEKGWDSAVMLDSGTSSGCITPGGDNIIMNKEYVHNLILIYLKEDSMPPVVKDHMVCLDSFIKFNDTINNEIASKLVNNVEHLLEYNNINCIPSYINGIDEEDRIATSNEYASDLFISFSYDFSMDLLCKDETRVHLYTSAPPETATRNVFKNTLKQTLEEDKFIVSGSSYNTNKVTRSILSKVDAPACMVSCEFHPSPDDPYYVYNFITDGYLNKLAESITRAICKHFDLEFKTLDVDDYALDACISAINEGITDGSGLKEPITKQDLFVILQRMDLL